MRIFGYVGIGFLVVWLLASSLMAITVADTALVAPVALGATQSSPQPIQDLISQRQDQTESVPEPLQGLAEEAEDLLNLLD
jgi:hypothetical protein